MKIYLGSVWQDLQEERDSIFDALRELGNEIGDLEIIASDPSMDISGCLAEVSSSQVFIGLVSHSYRPIESEHGLSRIELEYRQALNGKIPRLIYFRSEEVLVPIDWIETQPELRTKLSHFKNEVINDETKYFRSADDLARQTVMAVSKLVIASRTPGSILSIRDISQAVSRGVIEEFRQTIDKPLRAFRPRVFRQVHVDVDSKLCFVIMPSTCKIIYQDHLKPTVEKDGFKIICEEDLIGTGAIHEDIWEQIHKAHIIIGDLTGASPAVYYWIGISHAIGKHVILISQSEEAIPMHLRQLHCIIYQFTPPGVQILQDKLQKTIRLINAE